ncbi:uroporphyrinogen decarboxylase family protein [Eubacteriaceae bacterium ES3]|nr:uroporphyrinogen decarboxylase family protein [Eubacteriaceae bacterium ES3]
MLTKRQNLLETIKGGNPDRFVKQYEFMDIIMEAPIYGFTCGPGMTAKDPWGVTIQWPEGQPGPFPVHDDEHIVLKDVTEWKEYVKMPSLDFPDEAWAPAIEHANAIDRNEVFAASFYAPGIFERLHYLMGMEDALMAFYEEPEALKELIDYITEYEIKFADVIIEKLKPDALFHHDDWGSSKSTFISPAMFAEFIMPAYKKIYQHYKDNGIEIIVHHSDSYGETIVPSMIEMGMDIWQGCMSTNDIPKLIKEYGGQISFMGGLDNGVLDKEDWTQELMAEYVGKACNDGGKNYFIPSLIMGGPGSVYPGVYEAVDAEIDNMSKEMF